MVQILVDADALPRDALQAVLALADRFDVAITTVSSVAHEIQSPHHISVDSSPQAADMKIIGLIERGVPTLVVTQDYGLAALALAKGAAALSPTGREYTEANIDLLLQERELHAKQRRATGRSKGPKARTADDREAFRRALEQVVQRLLAAGS